MPTVLMMYRSLCIIEGGCALIYILRVLDIYVCSVLSFWPWTFFLTVGQALVGIIDTYVQHNYVMLLILITNWFHNE